jgi:hypothetical protein
MDNPLTELLNEISAIYMSLSQLSIVLQRFAGRILREKPEEAHAIISQLNYISGTILDSQIKLSKIIQDANSATKLQSGDEPG